MKVFDRIAEAFVAEGVTAMFGLMGSCNAWWMHSMHKRGVKLYDVRYEGAGLFMADGWARATNQVGVASATDGPGTAQMAAALITASRALSPVVAFVGEPATTELDNAQQLDHARFADACESGFVRLTAPQLADDVVRKAFYLARTESRPILLSCPIDFQDQDIQFNKPYTPSTTSLAQHPLEPRVSELEAALDSITRSRRPVIVVGRGARWANAGEAVLQMAERIGALIATSLMAKTWLAEDDFHAGMSGRAALKTANGLFSECDLVIGVGASLNRYTTEHGTTYPNARYLQIDVKPGVLDEGSPRATATADDCYIQADARLAVEALNRLLDERSYRNVGYRTPDVRARLARNFADPGEFPIEPGRLDPRDVCRVLDETIPTDMGMALGGGSHVDFAVETFQRPRYVLGSQNYFGCVSQMLPATMGAIAATGQPMFIVDGDATVMMSLSEFDTAVRYRWPLLLVVNNNEGLVAEYMKLEQRDMPGDLAMVPSPDFGLVARALGGKGCLVRTLAELRAAANEWVDDPCPMIIDARIAPHVRSIRYRRGIGQDV